MNNNDFPQKNNNDLYNNQQSPPQWGANPPPAPYYSNDRMRAQETAAKSSVIPILVTVIVILLIAICLIGGYLLGKNKGAGSGNSNNQPLAAALETTIAATEPAPSETQAAVTETAVNEAATTAATEAITEAPTTVQTSVVVSVQVVTEAPKTIFVGDYICEVRVATQSTDLNMREAPTTSAKIIGSIPKDTIVSYYSGGTGSWGIVYYNGKYGYVNTAYISTELSPSNHVGHYGGVISYAVVNANGGLNLRSSDSTSSSVITLIPNGTELPVYSSYDGWSYVSYNGNYGYVSSSYLKFK